MRYLFNSPGGNYETRKRAFTMFELVVVIAVIAVVAATIIPEFSGMFTLAKKT